MTKSDGQQFLPIHVSTKRGIIEKHTHTHTRTHTHTHTHTLFLLRERYSRTYVQSVSYEKNIHIILTQRITELQTVSVFSMKYS